MSLRGMQDKILVATLPHVPFDGWTQRSLAMGAVDAGYRRIDGRRAFPTGILELVEHFADYGDRQMVEALAARDLESMRIRERITTAVRTRLEIVGPYREAVKRALSYLALPQNGIAAARCTYKTVDAIWYAAGDRSADFSFYTKRAQLAGVYGGTLLYWLSDMSDGNEDSWAFLDRRIEGVMRITRARARIEEKLAGADCRLKGLLRRPRFFSRA